MRVEHIRIFWDKMT